MELFMKATRLKLTFNFKGIISVEDLWDLSLTSLDSLAQKLHAELEAAPKQSFIKNSASNQTSSITQLKFDVVLAVLETKVAERDEAERALVRKQEIAQLDSLIAKAEGEALASKPLEELKALRKQL